MADALLPSNEEERLEAVRRYDVLDTPPDGTFDRVATLAARLFGVPFATVSIVDRDRIWFKARQGIDVEETGRDPGLCASVILQDAPYAVTDALIDPRTLENRLVRGELQLRFYAAAPITTHDGYNLGTVNVIGREPREVTADELATLRDLAAIVGDELELRLAARRTVERERGQKREAERLIDILQKRLLPRDIPPIPALDVATFYRPVSPALDAGGDYFDVIDFGDGMWCLVIGDVCGKGPEAAAVAGGIRYMLRALASVETRPSALFAKLNDALIKESLDERFCTACCVRIDTSKRPVEAVVCSAGHPLPLLRKADGGVSAVGRPGQLLGCLPEIEVSETAIGLGRGDMLLLYTDGAVEQRGLSLAVGEEALTRSFAEAGQPDADDAMGHLRRAVERQQHETPDDDIALVLARVGGP